MRGRVRDRWCRRLAGVALAALATAARPAAAAAGEDSTVVAAAGSAMAGMAAESRPSSMSSLSPARTVALFDRLATQRPAVTDSLLAAELARTPGDPFLLLARMKSSWWQILEGRDGPGRLAARMREDLSRLQDCLEGRLGADPTDAEAAWLLGEAHCTLGRLDALQGRTWSAFRHHQRGVGLLEDVRRLRPDAPEPRSSIGLYRYYAARLPRSLRVLGRIAGLRGDREGGLADLRAAASSAGLQRTEAQFFLVQVLQHEEGETLEALSIARLAHAHAPRHLGFALELADVLVGMHRPDAALEVLAAHDTTDACARGQAALLRARVYADTGRPAAALAALDRLDARDRRAVSWLEPWIAIVRGTSLAAIGQRAAARIELERATRSDDAAGSKAAAAAALASVGDPLAVALVRAESTLTWGGDPRAARVLLEQTIDRDPLPGPSTAVLLALGRAALQQGDARGAIAPLGRAVEQGGGDEVALVVGPRVRLLQALLWGGEIEEARKLALRFEPELGRWGTNRQLALLVDGILHPPEPDLRLQLEPAATGGERFQLADLGFTSVDLVLRRAGGSVRLPMAWMHGAWVVVCPLPPGVHPYGFAIEGSDLIVDPEANDVVVRDGAVWSIRRVEAAS